MTVGGCDENLVEKVERVYLEVNGPFRMSRIVGRIACSILAFTK